MIAPAETTIYLPMVMVGDNDVESEPTNYVGIASAVSEMGDVVFYAEVVAAETIDEAAACFCDIAVDMFPVNRGYWGHCGEARGVVL